MQCGNNILPRTWSTEAVAGWEAVGGSDDCPPSRIGRTWSTEAVAGSDDCPPSPAVSPVSEKQVSFDGTIKLHHYMVGSHMKSIKKAMEARKVRKAVRKAAGATRMIASTRV
jgi:hypothetical protein